jgi:hypothetical protein
MGELWGTNGGTHPRFPRFQIISTYLVMRGRGKGQTQSKKHLGRGRGAWACMPGGFDCADFAMCLGTKGLTKKRNRKQKTKKKAQQSVSIYYLSKSINWRLLSCCWLLSCLSVTCGYWRWRFPGDAAAPFFFSREGKHASPANESIGLIVCDGQLMVAVIPQLPGIAPCVGL